MPSAAVIECDRSLEALTDKQFEILAHLADHKTSKEIARALDVTQNTVDKHLTAVRRKWNTADRYQTVRLFERLRAGGDEIHPPRISADDSMPDMLSMPDPDLPASAAFRLSDSVAIERFGEWEVPAPAGLQALDQRFGKAWRIAAIPLLALAAFAVMICAVAAARVLSDLF
jgi:DNA-binding CsgD family transcriptional regulator